MSRVPVRRALLSVSDKAGLLEFASRLVAQGVEVVSSGGTAKALSGAGLPVTAVYDLTGAPEMLGGRVKTLHPDIHGGILADLGEESHRADLAARGIEPFQLVVVNLYPFQRTVADPSVTPTEAIEQIDIGGPTMVRAAAKNHEWVAIVTSPAQYAAAVEAIEGGGFTAEERLDLARAAFFHTASYDAAIVRWLERAEFPPVRHAVTLEREAILRYGENPHQAAGAYAEVAAAPYWTRMRLLQGKEMSFNNHLDTEAAWRLANDLPGRPTVVIVKHANACGVAGAEDLATAFTRAWACDPLSAFGGVVALNRPLDAVTASRIIDAGFVEVVIAPKVSEESAALFAEKRNLRLIEAPPPDTMDPDFRRIEGGFVLQGRDAIQEGEAWDVVTTRSPSAEEESDLRFAWVVAAHTKSNAIVIAKDGAAMGVGAGDQSRVGASERAVARAGTRAEGAVAASDAFFPFRDGIDALAAVGVTAVIEPGGSVRDEEVIAAANEHGMALVFTGHRHFRH
jgi:phosphoribosylaminoimidazolecarboxamide formyltransferase/IMP cyclohydrolase